MKKAVSLALILVLLLSACSVKPSASSSKLRTFYEIYVGSFYDSDGDGSGDLRGIIEKLDYLNNKDGKDCLGIDGLWLMPVMPSPSYHKYDVTDYYAIDPDYGTMKDFEDLIKECKKRGIEVVIDLVLNHTSTEHPWFVQAKQEVREGLDYKYANYYIVTDKKIDGTYYPMGGAKYYEGAFWERMPDLNMDNEELRGEIEKIAKFWLNKGVAGFRLDAAKHVYHTNEENLEFWTWFTNMCKGIKKDVYLVGEVWSGDNEIIPYYGTGLTSLFSFGFAGTDGHIVKAVRSGNGENLSRNFERSSKLITSRAADGTDALFVSNHDTDRWAGYVTELEKQKITAALYLLSPTNTFTYYGEEIAMTGSGKDENKRMAMIWSTGDKTGQTKSPSAANWKETVSEGVEEQLRDPDSLLNYYRRLISMRSAIINELGGEPKAVKLDKSVCAFALYNDGGEAIAAVLHNLTDTNKQINIESVGGLTVTDSISPDFTLATVDGSLVTIPPYGSVILKSPKGA